MRTISPADVEPLIGFEETAHVTYLDASLVVLGVHDKHPGGHNQDVVDVSFGLRRPAVIQDLEFRHVFQSVGKLPLSGGASSPRSRRLRLIAYSQDHAAQQVTEPSSVSSIP